MASNWEPPSSADGQPSRNLETTDLEPITTMEIGDILDRGPMGEVHRAHDTAQPGREVIAKVMHLRNDQDLEKSLREIKARKSIPYHEHVTDHYGHTFDGQSRVMLYREDGGLALDTYVQQTRLSPDEKVQLMRQISEGVNHIHKYDFVHRNLKPSNIRVQLRDGRPVCKVTDMELCRDTDEGVVYKGTGGIGPVEWRAPEMWSDEKLHYTNTVDVFSLGLLFYALMAQQYRRQMTSIKRNVYHYD